MIKPPLSSTSEAQSHNFTFLTIKTVVRKFHENDGNMCLDKAVLAQRGGGGMSGDVCALVVAMESRGGHGHISVHPSWQLKQGDVTHGPCRPWTLCRNHNIVTKLG